MTIQTMARKSLGGLNAAGGFLTKPRKPRWLYLTAFLLPVLIMGFMWAVNGVIPFGKKMILAHDQWHQYYPFFLDLRTRIREGHSLFHSWTTGMGINYFPLFAYYLASPLNLPAVLLPESLLMPWYTLMVLVRLGLAGLFCAYFLKKTFGREDLSVTAFSTAYAFCAFLMGYYWNAIWLDTVALLPLVTLGTFSLMRDRRYVLYTASLSLAVFCNYYIGLFICIWVLLLFIGWHIVNWDDLAGFWTRFWRIGLFTLIALGMTAFLTIPTFLGLQSTSSAENSFPAATAMNIVSVAERSYKSGMELINRGELKNLFAFFGKQAPVYNDTASFTPTWIGGREALTTLRLGYFKAFLASFRIPLQGLRDVLSNAGTLTTPTTMEGLPNIFCGFITLVMAALYLFTKRIPLRERLFTLALLLFFGCSFLFRTLDYLWHGMHFPNMLPHRFSFLWSFTVIFMAFRAYTQIEHLPRWRAVFMVIPVTLLLYCVIAAGHRRVTIATTLVAVFALALLLFYSFRITKKELLALGLCVCMLAESLGCAILGVSKIGFTDSSYYPTKKEDTASILETMFWREEDSVDLWRAEMSGSQTLNDGTLHGYNGISCFSSAANSRISAFLYGIGLASSVLANRYVYQQADPFTNLLLGLKYMIDRHDENLDPQYFLDVAQQGEVRLLENRAYISLGFMVGDKTLEYDVTQLAGLPYERLNQLFREMTGLEEELYHVVKVKEIEAEGDPGLSSKTSTSFVIKGACNAENYVKVMLEVPETGMFCIYSKGTGTSDVNWLLNGETQKSWTDSYGYNRCMGFFNAGDQLELHYSARKDRTGYVTVGAACFDTALFDRGYAILSERSMIPTEVTDTHVEGAVRVQEPGLLYLSIPYDDGWTLTVDGEETRITPVGDAFIAVHLEPGLHAVALDYETPGFSLGLKISVVCLAAFLVCLIAALLSRFTNPPIVKVPVALADPRRDEDDPAPDAPPAAEPMPPKPTTDMPPLDLTQPWREQVREQGAGSREQGAGSREAEELSDGGALIESADSAAEDAFGPHRELLSTTGVFDPSKLPPEDSPGSFDRLNYLERLEKLLEETEPGEENGAKTAENRETTGNTENNS